MPINSDVWRRVIPHDLRRALVRCKNPTGAKRIDCMRTSEVAEDEYSFRPFLDAKCIFVHIPKAAGVSVCQGLFGCMAGGHKSLENYALIFSKHEFQSFFKFTFVRNPWARVYSAYSFLMQGGLRPNDVEWARHHLAGCSGFEDFVLNRLSRPETMSGIHFRPQLDFLTLYGSSKLSVDFVGYFENIASDYKLVQNRLGLTGSRSKLRHSNQTSRAASGPPSYLDAYTDEMIAIVQDIYYRDISTFGYEFDNHNLKFEDAERPCIP